MTRPGKDFEKTICEFYRGLDPAAEVLFDHHVMDRDTGRPRQVDVWVNCQVLGNISLRILISCKDHQRPLDVREVDLLLAEMQATRATNGVLYARNGFTAQAITKGQVSGVSCCRFFDEQPPERPNELMINAFVAHPRYVVMTEAISVHAPPDVHWHALFKTDECIDGQTLPVQAVISGLCLGLLEQSELHKRASDGPQGPLDMQTKYDLAERPACPGVRIHVAMTWDWFRGQLNAFRLTGSMNMAPSGFVGSATMGPVALNTTPHSNAWERCDPPLGDDGRLRITLTALSGPLPEHVVMTMAHDTVFGGGPWNFGPPSAELVAASLAQQLGPQPDSQAEVQITTHFGSKSA